LTDRALRRVEVAVAVSGVGVSAYLTWVHYEPAALICTRGGGCETVQHSHYAVLLGVPVAVFGLAAWTIVLALVVWDTPTAKLVVATLALAALAFAVYLVVLQLSVIHAVCVWCMVNDVLLVPALGVLATMRVLRDEA
jgi:uncharacterized membrane protein